MYLRNGRITAVVVFLASHVPLVHADDAAATLHKHDFGVDISFPMHYASVSTNYDWLPHNQDSSLKTPQEYQGMPVQPLGDKQSFYEEQIQGCVDYYGKKGDRCLQNERDRVEMSLRQPQSMKNYTEMGFTKIRAPEHVFNLIKEFWKHNKDKQTDESWPAGNTYTNHWSSPTYMVSVEDNKLEGGGPQLKQAIWDAARSTISEWTGQQLKECSLYGVRVYTEGSVLAPHVDRLPLVSSAIINVDQDVDEPWPLEVIGHDGRAHNVTMEPGDLVLYESHSVLHGRPFPLKGRFFANVFIHFEPIGPVGEETTLESEGGLPPYLIPGSPEEANWRRANPQGREEYEETFETGSTVAHSLAKDGNLKDLKETIKAEKELVNKKDSNGWTPLHESIRSEDPEMVRFLLENGADVNARTGSDGKGPTPLWWAIDRVGEDHPMVEVFKSYGGKIIGEGEL